MRATVFSLGNGIGVCHFRRRNRTWVAEIDLETMRVLPQSVRVVLSTFREDVEVEDEATDQDVIDRARLGLVRFRSRLGPLPAGDTEDWVKEAIAARDELAVLIERTRP